MSIETGMEQQGVAERLQNFGHAVRDKLIVLGSVGVAMFGVTLMESGSAEAAVAPHGPQAVEAGRLRPVSPQRLTNHSIKLFQADSDGNMNGMSAGVRQLAVATHMFNIAGPCSPVHNGGLSLYRANLKGIYADVCVPNGEPLAKKNFDPRHMQSVPYLQAMTFTDILASDTTVATESVGLQPDQYDGPARKLIDSNFGHKAILKFARDKGTDVRQLKELELDAKHGRVTFHEKWYHHGKQPTATAAD